MSYSKPGRTANETPHTTERPGEYMNRACGMMKKKSQLLGDNVMKTL